MRLELRAGVSPSEDAEKVLRAMKNVIGDCEYQTSKEGDSTLLLASTSRRCLEKIRYQLRDRRVRGAARRLLLTRSEGESVSIMLNRQAAFQGVIALCSREDESPLGPVFLKLESDHLGTLTDWLTGHEVW